MSSTCTSPVSSAEAHGAQRGLGESGGLGRIAVPADPELARPHEARSRQWCWVEDQCGAELVEPFVSEARELGDVAVGDVAVSGQRASADESLRVRGSVAEQRDV